MFKVSKVIEAFKRLRWSYKPRLAKAMRFTSVQHILQAGRGLQPRS